MENNKTLQGDDDPNFPDPKQSLASIQFLSKFDWIILVEGVSDIWFYNRFLTSFKIFWKKKHVKKELDVLLRSIPNKKKNTTRHKIIRLIEQEEDRNFFGIMDFDYGTPSYSRDIVNKIQFASPNSLETMLIQQAKIKNFSKLISNNQIDINIAESIVRQSILFAFKIGILRNYAYKMRDSRFCFSFTDDYSHFLNILKQDTGVFEFYFDLNSYLDELIMHYNNKEHTNMTKEILISEIHLKEEELLHKNNINWNIYRFCQGHDIIHFIEACIRKITDKSTDNLEGSIINNYKEEWFVKSKIYKWLKKIEKNKLKEKKSLTDPKYRDYIISVG